MFERKRFQTIFNRNVEWTARLANIALTSFYRQTAKDRQQKQEKERKRPVASN